MLNKEQKLAAHSTKPAIVSAGPGSGKTRTLVERVRYLLKNNISPTEILCFTFTRSAAKEMRERLEKEFNINQLTITTIHGFCLNLIRYNHYLLNFKNNILIYDDVDSVDLKKIIAKENNWHYTKDESKSSDINKINMEYLRILRENNAVNYEQMEQFAVKLLEKPELEYIKKRYRYIMVDEMQDISSDDYDLIMKLSEYHHNVFAVGDFEQELFGFRGSDPLLINEIKKHNKDGYEVHLNKSYRCPQEVLDLCNKLSGTNLVSCLDTHSSPQFQVFDNAEEEAAWIGEKIYMSKSESIGVLCRTNRMISFISDIFESLDIEHNIVGEDTNMMNEFAIRLTNSFFKLWYNKNDLISFRRVMSIIHDNVPERTIRRIKSNSIIEKKDLVESAEDLGFKLDIMWKPESDLMQDVTDLLIDWHADKGMTTKSEMVAKYQEFINEWFSDNPGCGIEDFLFYIGDMRVTDESIQEVDEHRVNLLTIHSAKGLEFDTVFIPGLTKNIFRASDKNTLFVAMSRTKNELYISYPKEIDMFGKTLKTKPSAYLMDIGFVDDLYG